MGYSLIIWCLIDGGVLLIEKYPERLSAPKAHALSPRSLEIRRQFGLDTVEMRKLGSPRNNAYWVNFVTNLSGIGLVPCPTRGWIPAYCTIPQKYTSHWVIKT